MTPRVLIVGSGPTGATYARRLLEQLPDVSVLMVEAGPVVTRPIGMNVKNVARPAGAGGRPARLPGPVARERRLRHPRRRRRRGHDHRPAGHPPDRPRGRGLRRGCRPPRAPRASAARACTGRAPRPPRPAPSASRSSTRRSGSEHLAAAEGLLHVYRPSFDGAPQADGDPGADPRRVRARTASPSGRCRWPPTRARTARCGGAARTSSSTACPTTPALHAARRDALRPGRPGGRPRRRRRPARPADRRRGGGAGRRRRAGRRRPPHAAADVGLRHPARRRSAGISPSTRCCSAWWPCGRTSCRRGTTTSGPVDPIRAIVAIPFDEERHPYSAQMMFSPVSPAPLPEGSRFRDNPAGYVGMGWGIRKRPRAGGPAHVRGRPARRERPARHPDRLRAHRRRGGGLRAGAQAPGPRRRRARRVRRRDAEGDAGRQLAALHGHRPHGRRPTTAPASATRTRGCGACPASCWPATA